ncbi:RodZ family helix-turn-helix domain-containing protein [Halomicronema sp. CCY15110]|uniref:helix-turn-helix domain-containing protein n=1 Tax=Halomicronema sp. CCY15110 TaxID=2767773 RepID=UPI00195148C0|nr:helix-turn-helix domain-containing protein [Halomicronema sp. CCY15110]
METPKAASKLSSSTEYALIFGAGASAAMSLAAQQIAAASVPVTALVAIGLLNRHRLDRQIQASEPLGSLAEEQSPRDQAAAPPTVTAPPRPTSPAPRPHLPTTPVMGPAMSPSATPMMSSPPPLRFAPRQQRAIAAQQALQAAQAESLERIGTQLQQLRTERGLTLQDIHQQTYIQRYALQAIEQGDLDALPEPFYICAFIKKYAIALGLPGGDIANQFPLA